jgi:hypothetical protein
VRGYVIAALIGVAAAAVNAALNLAIMSEKGAGIGARDVTGFAVAFLVLPLVTVAAYATIRLVRSRALTPSSRR